MLILCMCVWIYRAKQQEMLLASLLDNEGNSVVMDLGVLDVNEKTEIGWPASLAI